MSVQLRNVIILEGFLVLSLQILISVLLTPYFGNSFTFWVLSLFYLMFALAIGYFLASKFKNLNNKFLSKFIFTIFLYLCIVFTFSTPLLFKLIDLTSNYYINLSLTFIIFLFIPICFLACLPIFIITIKEGNNGQKSGDTFSLSSVSGILGILILTFFLLPYTGFIFSLFSIFTVSFFILYRFNKSITQKNNYLLILYILFSIIQFGIFTKEKNKLNRYIGHINMKEIQHGVHSELKVVDNLSLTSRFLYVNNVPQTKAHFTGRSLYSYLYSLSIYASVKPKNSNVLLAGLGGGNLIYELSLLDFKLDVVDIDDRLPNLVDKYFIKPKDKYNFIKSDIRRYLKISTKKYDVIILDLSYGETIPTNVFTKECFQEAKNNLAPNGILLIHFLSSLSEDGYKALASIAKTLKSAGLEYYLMNRMNKKNIFENVKSADTPDAYIFAASIGKFDFSKHNFIVDRDIPKEIVPDKQNLYLNINEKKGIILTDDCPILDVLQQKNVMNLRKENIIDIKNNFK